MSASTKLDTTSIVLLLVGAIVLIPLLVMGMGFGGMMGYGGMMSRYGTTGGWWPLIGMGIQLLFLIALFGGGYLLYHRLTTNLQSTNAAMGELRLAYARGELTDEEFETRREKLE